MNTNMLTHGRDTRDRRKQWRVANDGNCRTAPMSAAAYARQLAPAGTCINAACAKTQQTSS